MKYALHASEQADGRLFDTGLFTQRLLAFSGDSEAMVNPHADELLYVVEGTGRLVVDGEGSELKPGVAAFAASGTFWSVADPDGLSILSVLVHGPAAASRGHAVLDLTVTEKGTATAGRQFVLGATPEVGCESATQFVGLIPPGRAPDHFHTYDEVIYVLAGEGVLEIGGEQAPLLAGTCVHLPARLVHCLANTGPSEMRVLGVFRPAGSPAEAYYPDGTAAVVPDRS